MTGNLVGNLLRIHIQYWPSRVILTAIDLNLFSILGERLLNANELSEELGIKLCCAYDFFDALVALRFLKRMGDGKDATYSNFNGVIKMLDKDRGFVLEGYKAWDSLKQILQTGRSFNAKDSVAQTATIYDDALYGDEGRLAEFHDTMDIIQEEAFKLIVDRFDFSYYNTLLDLGSGSCLLSKILHSKYPNLLITNFDLPGAFPKTVRHLIGKGYVESIGYVSGDFFKDVLPTSEVITMCSILHNWSLEKKKLLIQKVYNSLLDNGIFIVIENLIDDLRRVNSHSLLMSLNMLIEFGEGFEFTVSEFRTWAFETGFKDCKFIQLTDQVNAIVAYK